MRQIAIFLLMFSAGFSLSAQTHEEAAVEAVILQVFEGMRKSDSSMVRNAFTKEVLMATVARNKKNEPILHRETSMQGFLNAVSSPKAEVWNEEIWNLKIQIDGDFASAWCDYAFYVGKTFSHCGVDAFHLHKTDQGWKIFHIADTRRKEGCIIPNEISKKYQ